MPSAIELLERIAILIGRQDEREEQKHDPGILKGRNPEGWQGSTQLITGNPTPINILAANFPHSGEYTIEFNLIGSNTQTNQPIVAQAMIQWSVEGSTVTRIINIVDGASISGVAQGVTVFAFDATQEVHVEADPFGIPYVVTAQVSRGTRGTNKQPPTLIPGFPALAGKVIVDSGVPANVPIPQGAGVISVYITVGFGVSPEPDSNAVFVQQAFISAPFVTKQYDPRDFPDWVPLSPGADTITLVNNSGAPVSFSVTFGVDG